MVDQFLTQKVTVAYKAKISTNSNLWKDEVDVRVTLGRRGEARTVQGGGIDIIPAEIISNGEFEVPLATDVLETVDPAVNPDSLSFWIQSILDNGAFPDVTITKVSENRDANTATLEFVATILDIVPGDKAKGEATEKTVVRFIPKTFTKFVRSV